MITDRNLLGRHCNSYSYGACFAAGGSGGDFHFHGLDLLFPLKRAFSMADGEPSPAPEDEHRGRRDDDDEDDDSSTSGGWLRLGPASTPPSSTAAAPSDAPATRLDLLFSGRLPPSSSSSSASVTYPVAWAPPPAGGMAGGFRAPPVLEMAMPMVPWMSPHLHRPEMPSWGRWSNPGLGLGGASSTVVQPPAIPDFVARQFVHPISASSPLPTGAAALRPDVRVVSPPRRPQSGVWITLQAMRDQGREPFLPQIPKSYLRIKDGRRTIRLLIKYLVNKLGLEDESEVEITCRGQMLPPSLTLQNVRDSVWWSRDQTPFVALLQDSRSGGPHIMMLEYCRSSCAFKTRT